MVGQNYGLIPRAFWGRNGPRSQLCGCGSIGVWEDLGLPAAPASAPRLVCGSGGYDVEADRLGAKGCPDQRKGLVIPVGPGTHYGYWPVDGIRCLGESDHPS